MRIGEDVVAVNEYAIVLDTKRFLRIYVGDDLNIHANIYEDPLVVNEILVKQGLKRVREDEVEKYKEMELDLDDIFLWMSLNNLKKEVEKRILRFF